MDPNAAEQLLQGSTASVASIWPSRFSLLESVNSPATSAHTIAICDDELQRLSRTAEKARSALGDSARHVAAVHNRYSLIGILPDDILFLVFHMCSSLGSTREQLRTVLALSQVCSYWRSLSLAYPILWSRIDLSSTPERLVWLFCARSRNCPLTITWPLSIYSTLRRDFASALCKQNLSRMSQLSLAATRDQLMPWLCDGIAPNVQKVFLQDADAFAYSPLILHRPLFGGNTPHLRHLSLVGIRMPWSAGVYHNLITLEIMRCNIGPYGPNDLDIRHVFRDSPLLEDLHLSFSTPFGYKVEQDALLSTQSSLVEEGRMPLRALRKLKLDLPITYVAHILQSIALPPVLSELSLCLDSPQSHISLLTDILHPSLLPAETLTTIDRLRVCDCTSFGGIQIRGYAPGADAEDRPRWEYAWKHRSRLPRELLGRVARALHTQYRVRSIPTVQLVAENGYCNNTDDVLSLLAQMPHMTALHTLSWSPNILCGMRDACEAGTPWPHLRELRVVLCGFEPDMNAVLDALVGLCRVSREIQTVDIMLRIALLHDAEIRAVKQAVQSIHDKDVAVSCRHVDPYQLPGLFEPEERFVVTECNVSRLACWR